MATKKPARVNTSKSDAYTKTYTAGDQKDSDMFYDGIDGSHIQTKNTKWSGNHSGLKQKQVFKQERVGNASDSSQDRMEKLGPSATFDPVKKTIATAAQAKNPVESGRATREYPSDPDRINAGNNGGRNTRTFLK